MQKDVRRIRFLTCPIRTPQNFSYILFLILETNLYIVNNRDLGRGKSYIECVPFMLLSKKKSSLN